MRTLNASLIFQVFVKPLHAAAMASMTAGDALSDRTNYVRQILVCFVDNITFFVERSNLSESID